MKKKDAEIKSSLDQTIALVHTDFTNRALQLTAQMTCQLIHDGLLKDVERYNVDTILETKMNHWEAMSYLKYLYDEVKQRIPSTLSIYGTTIVAIEELYNKHAELTRS